MPGDSWTRHGDAPSRRPQGKTVGQEVKYTGIYRRRFLVRNISHAVLDVIRLKSILPCFPASIPHPCWTRTAVTSHVVEPEEPNIPANREPRGGRGGPGRVLPSRLVSRLFLVVSCPSLLMEMFGGLELPFVLSLRSSPITHPETPRPQRLTTLTFTASGEASPSSVAVSRR